MVDFGKMLEAEKRRGVACVWCAATVEFAGKSWRVEGAIDQVTGKVRLRSCLGPDGQPSSQDVLRGGLAQAIKVDLLRSLEEVARKRDGQEERWVPGSQILFNACRDVANVVGGNLAEAFQNKQKVTAADMVFWHSKFEQVRQRLTLLEEGAGRYFAEATVEEPVEVERDNGESFKARYGIDLDDIPW